jgi:T-complex protein 1 subunit delta
MDEAERSIHDALCVLRCLVKNKGIVSGGGAIEVEIAKHVESFA